MFENHFLNHKKVCSFDLQNRQINQNRLGIQVNIT